MNAFIYGLGILTLSYLGGQFAGELLGQLLNVEANVGGVGFAMLFLIFFKNYFEKYNTNQGDFSSGIHFWNQLYVPIVIAMSASQNVRVAVNSGFLAVLAGLVPTILVFYIIPIIVKILSPTQK